MAARRGPLGCWFTGAAALALLGLVVAVIVSAIQGPAGADAGTDPAAAVSGGFKPPILDDLPPPPADAVALLGGLRPGDKFGGLTVTGIAVLPDRRLSVRVAQSYASGFALFITTLEGDKNEPPVKTERYKLFAGDVRTYDGPITPEGVMASLNLMAERLQRTEKTVPTPQGM